MPGRIPPPREPADAGCVDDSQAVVAADATSAGDFEPDYEEFEPGGRDRRLGRAIRAWIRQIAPGGGE
jgi:hypothetical protein